MDQIDEKYKTKEEEQYLDPDKGFAELRDPTAPRPIADDRDAIKSFKGDFAFLAPDAGAKLLGEPLHFVRLGVEINR